MYTDKTLQSGGNGRAQRSSKTDLCFGLVKVPEDELPRALSKSKQSGDHDEPGPLRCSVKLPATAPLVFKAGQ